MAVRQSTPVQGSAAVRKLDERLIIPLPEAASSALPSRGQVAVDAVLNGHGLVTVVEPDGRKGHWLRVDDALRRELGLQEGTAVEFTLTPTKTWPEPEIPSDLGAALEDADDLEPTWASLTPMARWEWVRWVGATRNPDTRARRVEVSIDKLRHGKRRPCCFDLASCTDPELARSGTLKD
ncbi:MAG: YdeI/OmpD-associated family protein [Brachybacterium sp.]|nr:YdeI/OmpD-associated family protein [Brachybacterium sp.]MDN5898857.1 YdeI/OmpD-associated family protein [Brachybacterium sp.]